MELRVAVVSFDKPQKGNPNRLSVRQHVFPVKSIARFADDALVMSEGRLAAAAPPESAFAADVLSRVFGVSAYRAEVEGEAVLVPWA